MADLRAVEPADEAEAARQEAWAQNVANERSTEFGRAMFTLGLMALCCGGLSFVLIDDLVRAGAATVMLAVIAWALPQRVAALVRADRLGDLLK